MQKKFVWFLFLILVLRDYSYEELVSHCSKATEVDMRAEGFDGLFSGRG